MKKILSILLLFASILTLTACESDEYDKSIYVADDHSYLMIHGTKYILVEGLPVDFSDTGHYDVHYKGEVADSVVKVWDYTGAQRYPWVGLFDEYFYMKDVILPNGIMIKYVSFDVSYTYCLPEDLEGVLSLFEDFKWSRNKVGIDRISSVPSCELSPRLSEYIANLVEKNTNDDAVRIITDKETRVHSGVLYDEKMCVQKAYFHFYFLSADEIYVLPLDTFISKKVKEGCINIELAEAGDYRVSEEYREELISAFREAYKDEGKEIFWPE